LVSSVEGLSEVRPKIPSRLHFPNKNHFSDPFASSMISQYDVEVIAMRRTAGYAY
jgi:hypothetical protein